LPGAANAATTARMTGLWNPSLADLYAAIALFFGAFFVIATPPFGTGDETAHLERAYEVASGAFLGADGLPAGMQRFIDDAFGKVKSGEAVGAEDYRRWSGIVLDAGATTPWPEPVRAVMRLHSPLCYLHFAPATAAGVALGLPPMAIFYLGRVVALLAGVFLVRAAVTRAPASLRPPLVFFALLPTTVVYFGGFNIESLLVGLAFYYFALVASLAENADRRLTRADVTQLVAIAFLLGQFKTGYLLLPATALILPAAKFRSLAERVTILALIILPGAVMSLGWAIVVKDGMIGDIVYSTVDGNRVAPAEQLAGVLADPVGYAGVVLRTLFASDAPQFAWMSLLALGGWTNIAVPAFVYALLGAGLFLVWLSGGKAPAAMTTRIAIGLQLAIFAATAGAILTLVYFQWNGVGAKTIDGFQGRYLIAAAPLLFALAPLRLSFLATPGRREAFAIGAPLLGLIAMSAAVLARYW
jgi:hypothetical protein